MTWSNFLAPAVVLGALVLSPPDAGFSRISDAAVRIFQR